MTAPEPREAVTVAEVLADVLREHMRLGTSGRWLTETPLATFGNAIENALAPLIAERERAAAVEALREAADEIDASVGSEPVLMHVVDWVDGVEYAARRVRDRADRRAER